MRKTVSVAMLIIALFALATCSGNQQDANNAEQSETQATVTAPTVSLHAAVIQGNLEAVQQHIKAGSDLDQKEPSLGSSPLITAAVFGKTEIAKALIAAGADVNYKNMEGSTALHSAALFCNTDIVKALLDNGADKNMKNQAGRIAIDAVAAPFERIKPIYDHFGATLGPLGLTLDYEQLKRDRVVIAEMLGG